MGGVDEVVLLPIASASTADEVSGGGKQQSDRCGAPIKSRSTAETNFPIVLAAETNE
jgi:hypothetical protein